MTAKEYLSEIQYLLEDIKISKKIVDNYHISITTVHGMDYSGDKVQSSPRNALEEAGWQMLSDQHEAKQHLTRSTVELNRRLKMMRSLSKPLFCEVLFQRYYNDRDFREIAKMLKKKDGTIRNVHAEALEEFEKKYSDTLKSEPTLKAAP